MPRILDNIDVRLDDALRRSLTNSHRLDACVGYFNLRGWGLLVEAVDGMPSSGGEDPKVRLLLGADEQPRRELQKLLDIVHALGPCHTHLVL